MSKRSQSRNPLTLREAGLTKQVRDFLEYRHWLLIRRNAGRLRGIKGGFVTLGKKGTPDWAAVRPLEQPGQLEGFFFELKKRGEKPSPLQLEALENLRSEGFMAEWFDTIDDLEVWYELMGFRLRDLEKKRERGQNWRRGSISTG